MEICFLGTGTSQGVPVIACECEVCTSLQSQDKRLRTSIMLSYNNKNIVIDTGPDFRQQMLRERVSNVEAIVYTHEHKDHVAGMDDLRAFNFKHKKDIPLYVSKRVEVALKREFHYVFELNKYPGIPEVKLVHISKEETFDIGGKKWIPIEVMHHKLPVLNFRIEDFAYITDANYISDIEFEKLKGVKVLVINALRREKHISHFTLEEALEIIKKLNVEKAYLTHISHQLGLHLEVEKELPPNVVLAYDGLKITVD
ncbi:MAG: MBL fold metallo-hydrolase [Flavobacteriales bacterium]